MAPTQVGTTELDGESTDIVTFSEGGSETPIWFRVWVDSGGLVLRSEMRAPGHFMDDRYYDFDTPITIEPPAGPIES